MSQPDEDLPTIDMAGEGDPSAIDATIETAEFSQQHLASPHDDLTERYQLIAHLGAGAFGVVYKALDRELKRFVAIKVPQGLSSANKVGIFLAEAQILAQLDHPGIVPVYHTGQTSDGRCFVVSKYVEGSDLRRRMRDSRLSCAEAARIVIAVAEALQHAHERNLVHRDIKPANILLDLQGHPIVTDFGLALREEDFGKGPIRAGTPAYMSPEQAQGESHRVDVRSDVYSLGVVFYELLTGERPFQATDPKKLIEQVCTQESRPPRQLNGAISGELERICLKCLAKRRADRYGRIIDLAEDLRLAIAAEGNSAPGDSSASAPVTPWGEPTSEATEHAFAIVPKGLRAFDAGDADFFLELLPGPRDRDGLPEILRFWKQRIEEHDPAETFSVGVLYAPSGSGKSSLVKAGLLPRLSAQITVVYVEAAGERLEETLLHALRRRTSTLPPDADLAASLSQLRQADGQPGNGKVLLVLDQFEQWLHSSRLGSENELVRALRQCDGEHVQALLLVRDEFWMAITRFMRALELPLVEGKNSAAVDLFDVVHARRILVGLGRAYGTLPGGPLGDSQEAFVDRAAAGLAEDGKVVAVRLSLFAEMVKNSRWLPETLRDIGGMEGVGVAFLEQTFSSSSAPPEHRRHEHAARAVLQALLPAGSTNLKGHQRSADELLRASGYSEQPREFLELVRVLDAELRIISPCDPESSGFGAQSSTIPTAPGGYQLTHDYLVPAIRQWLTRKQQETWRGRAELCLEERTGQWLAKRDNRNLPGPIEFTRISLGVPRWRCNADQRALMSAAGRYYGVWLPCALVLLACIPVGWFFVHKQSQTRHADDLVASLMRADLAQAPEILAELEPLKAAAAPALRRAFEEAPEHSRQRLFAGLALLPGELAQNSFLSQRLLISEPGELVVLVPSLVKHGSNAADQWWKILGDAGTPGGQRLRAACALAAFDPVSARWNEFAKDITSELVHQDTLAAPIWARLLRPVRQSLASELRSAFLEKSSPEPRYAAAVVLSDFLSDQTAELASLIPEADARQIVALASAMRQSPDVAIAKLREQLQPNFSAEQTETAKEQRAHQQASCAMALLALGDDAPIWPLLRSSKDPRLQTILIHQLPQVLADPQTLWRKLGSETEPSVKAALLLSLGEYEPERFTNAARSRLVQTVATIYRDDPDPGIHSAAEWLLTRHGQKDRLIASREELIARSRDEKRNWYVTVEGQTMLILNSSQGPLAVSSFETTVDQFRRFRAVGPPPQGKDAGTTPVNSISPSEAAEYCNWLSMRERIPPEQWCYERKQGGQWCPRKNFTKLHGFRLPTEPEWEFASRGGAVTNRFFGEADEYLRQYAWYLPNSNTNLRVIGLLEPNAYGLFDVYGNVSEWCEMAADIENSSRGPYSVCRGGSIIHRAPHVNSTYRVESFTRDLSYVGFRVVRTCSDDTSPKKEMK